MLIPWQPLCVGTMLAAVAAVQTRVEVGPAARGRHLVPTRQLIRAAGQTLEFPGRPVDLAVAPDGRTVYLKDNRGVVVLDAEQWTVRQQLPFPQGGGSMHGIAVTRDGKRILATSAQNHLWIGRAEPDGKVAWDGFIPLPGRGGRGDSAPCGIALSGDEQTAYVCLSRNNTLGVVDLAARRLTSEIPTGIAPFDVALAPGGQEGYVSNWGGRHPRRGERSAPSSGTETLVDTRGVASSGSLSILDLKAGREAVQVQTDLHPSDVALSADGARVYVANANSDTVSVVGVTERKQLETILVRPRADLPFGSAPNALALSGDGRTLYVANGGNNAVAVVRLARAAPGRSSVAGFIPTGWYQGAVAVAGNRLYVANVKGNGSRHRPPAQKGWHVYGAAGTVNRVPVPTAVELVAYSAQVRADARVPQVLRALEKARSGVRPVPVPARAGEPSVFEHVVYVIKENRTYDQVFGDMVQGNGDPNLCIFGRQVTPNHHSLAEQFVLLDNFYCNGVNSADGHSWATEGNVTDHLEKSFGGFTRSYTFGDDPLTYSSTGFLWDNALLRGLSFRNYGEMDYAEPIPPGASFTQIYRDYVEKTGRIRFSQSIGIPTLRRYSSPDYPGWNMNIPDVLRADRFLTELKGYEQKGGWPNLNIVFLPNDHTSGTSPGAPTPRAQMADNDLALGRVVEGISRSRFWPKTCIFVIEDDPQDGFDHVDGHRSLCLVVSPYTRRGAVVSEFYNQTGVLHTMERILGLPPMNQLDAMAPVMSSCFRTTRDLRPYTALPNNIPLDEMNPPARALKGARLHWARKSLEQRLEQVDGVDEDTMNRILWHSARGVDAPYPAHMAGARDGREADD